MTVFAQTLAPYGSVFVGKRTSMDRHPKSLANSSLAKIKTENKSLARLARPARPKNQGKIGLSDNVSASEMVKFFVKFSIEFKECTICQK